ncbi:MAG: methionine--tRNA ligase [Candidatus Yonathbacteria bacterium CG_4_10_14_3_um_filter_47_65]|uniref:Methionine--tRNA ligase n=2 Tax=Parcubacteria group TaxID=1794811 RepID=A0A2M8D7G9_9BACT|nr:MAG: hypothetical protein AUJ44_04560 [Candidatus Nomurabacteria bacterium CG1_02_47_685]PIP03509.1 MAG: methionine--tRNA ligase [Candidatus Yonathbacteria bacterium CG23_combo_of_CG06-09_8_20_14_all_46_18]PIQ33273.1 MAG: methionine--tRNA ligase [Candidatus Yonathbacteria bacterium CG17_big_fil_post_rev_8_21_14_2_50_46_19]PIX56110.1 MAG: methionine--tRNA ligase [Candidatus Yonathbacteria bacterium CG_4_10_14_3_um_filter_47_65]PIY57546.1 MAG: methionine--tRNA ligase [Candidatus Yonathbacteria
MDTITFDDFKKLDIRIGTVTSAERVADTDKLIVLSVLLGEETRTIVSGIAEYFPEPKSLEGRQVPVITNLEPRNIRGIESKGMILYVVGDGFLTTLEPSRQTQNGTPVK